MSRYMHADLSRVFKKISRIVVIVILGFLIALTNIWGCETVTESVGSLNGNFSALIVLFGVLEIIYLFGDDFKAKTMQVAIGTGVKRNKIVGAKWLEFMIVSAADLLMYLVFSLIIIAVRFGLSGINVYEIAITFLMTWMKINCIIGVILFSLFWTQGIVMPVILYILGTSSLIPMVIQYGGTLLKLSKFHLQTYTLQNMLSVLEARFLLKQISVMNLLGVLIYMVLGFVIAAFVLKKKELEF